ncbi:oxidoreductase [Tolypocladium capitatum]|uniref:Oxidoreductase n=1 Tax=Tolypocladium capitatum TaxID=45235 RepID=A0A2K3QPM3_9HYPO|nr:oxidoreductase [Tolypocladium capitatum]
MAAAKVFVITGASKGIGAAIVQCLLAQSHKLVLAARSEHLLEAVRTSHPGQIEYLAGDMTSPDMPRRLTDLAVKSFGRVDGIVINHGLLDPQTIDGSAIEGWKHLYNVNVFSCLAVAKAGIPELRKTKGCIVWLSSGAATKPYMAWAAYGSSKAAINSISTHLAVEEPDITSITVAPGRVDTDMQAVIRSSGKDTMNRAQYDTFVEAFGQGKLLKPEQPGHVIAKFVAGPQRDLSGQCLNWNSRELAAYQE